MTYPYIIINKGFSEDIKGDQDYNECLLFSQFGDTNDIHLWIEDLRTLNNPKIFFDNYVKDKFTFRESSNVERNVFRIIPSYFIDKFTSPNPILDIFGNIIFNKSLRADKSEFLIVESLPTKFNILYLKIEKRETTWTEWIQNRFDKYLYDVFIYQVNGSY
jgi:hypothetical protein